VGVTLSNVVSAWKHCNNQKKEEEGGRGKRFGKATAGTFSNVELYGLGLIAGELQGEDRIVKIL